MQTYKISDNVMTDEVQGATALDAALEYAQSYDVSDAGYPVAIRVTSKDGDEVRCLVTESGDNVSVESCTRGDSQREWIEVWQRQG